MKHRVLWCGRCGRESPGPLWCPCGAPFDRAGALRLLEAGLFSDGDRVCRHCAFKSLITADACQNCGYVFDLPRQRPRRAKATGQRRRRAKSKPTATEVKCPSCSLPLRLAEPLDHREYRCPSCGCRFRASRAVVVEVVLETSPRSDDRILLGIPSDATTDDIRTAYRKRAREYHPDKVATLGADLQRLAEERMKAINAAYERLLARGSQTGHY